MFSLSAGRHGQNFLTRLAAQPAVLVQVESTRGSAPREAGAWMAVFADTTLGTVGGGNLEFRAIAQARDMLAAAPRQMQPISARYPLGPALGQCCGGVMQLRFELVDAADAGLLADRLKRRSTPLALFGGGHVGQALVRLLAALPFDVTWIDSRDAVFPPDVPENVACAPSEPPQAAVAGLAPRSCILVMSFSHAEDLDVVGACLRRQRERADLPFIGLIGSKTKWATFRRRLEARGYSAAEVAHITCPIGIPGIVGKEPEVIAVAVAAQLLQMHGQG